MIDLLEDDISLPAFSFLVLYVTPDTPDLQLAYTALVCFSMQVMACLSFL